MRGRGGRSARAAIVAVLAVLVAHPSYAAPVDPGRTLHWVAAANHSVLESGELVDEYDHAVTARLTPGRADALRRRGFDASPLDETVARGTRLDPALALQLPPDSRIAPEETSRFVVQFRGPIKEEWRERLVAAGVQVHDYLPHHAYLVTLTGEQRKELEAWPMLRAMIPYHPAFRRDPTLPVAGPVEATVLGFLDVSLERLLADLVAAGATPTAYLTTGLEHVVDVQVDASRLAQVVRLDGVAWVERALNEGSLDNELASAMTQAGSHGAWPLHERGVDGSSQTVSICDTGVNTQVVGVAGTTPTVIQMGHDSFTPPGSLAPIEYNRHLSQAPLPFGPHPKIALYYSPQEDGNRGDADDALDHGTPTAGILAGDLTPLATRNDHDGVSYASRLVVCDFHNANGFHILNDYDNYWVPAYAEGARVSSNSWGAPYTNNYTLPARQQDAFVWSHRDFVLVRSMGNTGPDGNMRPDAVAKSVIGVGATMNDATAQDLSDTSSGGPASDGRTKPNVVAPGRCLVTPTLPDPDSYRCFSGTSASTPVVAGAAALIRDYFAKGFYPSGSATPADSFEPSAALVRATLQVSGSEITGDRGETQFPNLAQGWGRVLLEDALFFDGDVRGLWLRDEDVGLGTGQAAWNAVSVEGDEALRVMLSWSDAPASAGASPAIVNDLDLLVIDPAGNVYRGNAFVGNAVPPNQGTADRINVEEAVYIPSPSPGTYMFLVMGANVPSGPQPFALVATGT